MLRCNKLWQYLGPIALASDYPTSQEGPNEMDLAWLPGEKMILAMVRLEYEACILCAGVDWR